MFKKTLLVLLCACTTLIFSCKKNDSGQNTIHANSSKVTTNADGTPMTMGDIHNQICADMIGKYAQEEQVDWSDVFNSISVDAAAYGADIPASLTYDNFKAKYFTNVTGWRDFYSNMKTAGDISSNLYSYVTLLADKLESEGDNITVDVMQKDIQIAQTSREYKALNQNDLAQAAIYHDGIVKSFTFWSSQVVAGNKTAKKGNPCSCKWGCWLCVAAFDAAGLMVPSVGLAVGPAASLIARCCICSCCANTNCS